MMDRHQQIKEKWIQKEKERLAKKEKFDRERNILWHRQEIQEKEDIWKCKGCYGVGIKCGAWLDMEALHHREIAYMKYKRDHCMLQLQKVSFLFKNLLKPIELSAKPFYVYYNHYYQIKASELPRGVKAPFTKNGTYGLFMSGTLNEVLVEKHATLCEDALLTCSMQGNPVVRNAFKIMGCNEHREGQVFYGDSVFIASAASTEDKPLYLHCSPATFADIGQPLRVKLTTVPSPDVYCRFQIFYYYPDFRVATSSSPVKLDTKVIIKHSGTGLNLSAEYDDWLPTFHGPECYVSCATYQDIHGADKAENIWMFCGNGDPGPTGIAPKAEENAKKDAEKEQNECLI